MNSFLDLTNRAARSEPAPENKLILNKIPATKLQQNLNQKYPKGHPPWPFGYVEPITKTEDPPRTGTRPSRVEIGRTILPGLRRFRHHGKKSALHIFNIP